MLKKATEQETYSLVEDEERALYLLTGTSSLFRVSPLTDAISDKEIERSFGAPILLDGDKVTRFWVFLSSSGDVFTVYDYCGDRWHVGGSVERGSESALLFVSWFEDHLG